jgi:hypothetical protein
MRVIEATFRRKPTDHSTSGHEGQESKRHAFITWGSFAMLVVGSTIVATALFLGSR